MKIALKYGLMITAGIATWVLIAHALVPNPESKVHSLGAGMVFNLLEILFIYLGIKARRSENAGQLNFKEGIKTGVSIAFVYAVSSCLFFVFELFLFGPKLMASKAEGQTRPFWQVTFMAFAGLFSFALLFGLFYSTVIAFALAKRRQR